MSDKSNPYNAEDTGHVWDDNLRELTNQPPKWWTIGFHASWIFVVVYSILYPTWPTLSGHTKGIMGWTSIGEYKEDLKAIEQVRAKYEEQLPGKTAAAILADSDLSQYVNASAKVLFGDNCAACHGNGGAGNPGYPVLVDDDWLYGGDVDTIQASITNGRKGVMPAQGANLTAQEINDVARHVMALSEGKEHEPGKAIYNGKGACMGCHGPDARGMHALGSVNLTDGIWRFASEDQLASVKYTITHGVNDASDALTRKAEMPVFGGTRLSETDIKKLAVYVHSLGGGQ